MTAFEFYLSFYGLLLGLSVAEVAKGCLNAVDARQTAKIGWLTPSLAAFVLFDITSFWLSVWDVRDAIHVNWTTMLGGLIVALTFYMAAGLVFPRARADWPDFTEHYWRNKRFVVGGVLLANTMLFVVVFMLRPPELGVRLGLSFLTFWAPVIALLFSKSGKLDLALLWFLNATYIVAMLTSWISTS